MDICSEYIGMEARDDHYLMRTNNADVKICFLTDEIVRVWASFDKQFHDESYVLMLTAWKDRMDQLFAGERVRTKLVRPRYQETSNVLTLSTDKVTLEITKEPLTIRLLTADGSELYRTLPGNPFTRTNTNRVTAYSSMKENDYFYGFGEKTGLLNKNKHMLREHATDAMGYDPQHTDTLYKHIPFYIRLDADTHKAVGVFYHNFYESVFNMGCEKSNYWSRYSYWQAEGGDIDLFLLGGSTVARIIDNYTQLTGRPVLLPKRALGYQGSSMYYAELDKDCDTAILNFIDTVKDEGIPIDGFHLSSGYTTNQEKRDVFTWNKERFPQPAAFFHAMNQAGAPVVPNVKPGILLCHPLLPDFDKARVFIKDSVNHQTNAVGKWWGGDGVFWDFTNPKAREVWKQYLTDALITNGTDSIWNDNCEYDSFLDTDALCDFDGKCATLGQLKPLMSNLMCKAGIEAVTDHDSHKRPYLVCRSGASGIQQYAQTWCGDNYTSWDTLKYNIPTILGMGLSGQPNEGADIGGFAGPAPEEELFVRWVQQGIFQPRFSIHSASDDNTVTEPWMYEGSTELIRDAIRLRYRFTPYLYSAEYLAHKTGAPIMRALVYDFQEDPNVYNESFQYMFGRDLMVANVVEPMSQNRKYSVPNLKSARPETEKTPSQLKQVYLPGGCRWYDWNDHYCCYEGGQSIEVPVTLATIPMFIRQGAVIAMADNPIMNMQSEHTTVLHLIVAPGADNDTILYDDDGVTNDYTSGVYLKTTITTTVGQNILMHFTYEGTYTNWVQAVHMELIAQERSPFEIRLDHQLLPHYLNWKMYNSATEGWYYNLTNRCVELKYPNPEGEYTLAASFEQFDLIGMDDK